MFSTERSGSKGQRSDLLWRYAIRSTLCLVLTLPFVANCTITSNQPGPDRPITIADDVVSVRPLADPDLSNFYNMSPANQAIIRNQILTARMYLTDLEYHRYEANLTREVQEEGFLATAVSLGLTTSATLIPVAQTDRLLSGIATGVIGLDKAYNEKELLSNTIQALQTQMRADRKTQAAVIYAEMFKDAGNNTKVITPIAEYTLPMALSDADAYYQAGTVASALIGLSKTVANAEQNAEKAKSTTGPNPAAVADAKATAAPLPSTQPIQTVRFVSSYASDNATTALTAYLYPNGVSGSRDSAHAKVINDFLQAQQLNVGIPAFLHSSSLAAQRAQLARKLNLIP